MTSSERKILNRLAASSPDCWARIYELRDGTGLTMRGFWIVIRRMEDANLITRYDKDGQSGFMLTFKGGRESGLLAA